VSIFWSHASMQGEYADYGDDVTFDTTHKTNIYDKPLGMFIGANSHLQCTVFGFVLLGDETVQTFEWAFNSFKTGMRGTESYANRYVVCEFVMLTRQIIYCDSQIMVCEQLQIKILQCQLLYELYFQKQFTDCVYGMFRTDLCHS
jgi:hypothetical protein